MKWLEDALNRCCFWFTGAAGVEVELDRARALVAEGKLDDAIALLKSLKLAHPAESNQAIIMGYEDDLRYAKANEIKNLIQTNELEKLIKLYDSAPTFYGNNSELMRYIAAHASVPKVSG